MRIVGGNFEDFGNRRWLGGFGRRPMEKINRKRLDSFLEKVRGALWVVKEKKIGVLSLAFKPNTHDIRFAPAIDLITRLATEGAHVRAFDPKTMEKARTVLQEIEFADSAYDVA
jgi:UDPglucose 6-dehydrogenase